VPIGQFPGEPHVTDVTSPEVALQVMNDIWTFVTEGSKTHVRHAWWNPAGGHNGKGGVVLAWLRKEALFDRYANKSIMLPSSEGEAQAKPIARWWWEHPLRNSKDAVVFDPRHPPGQHDLPYYNLWRGFAVKPVAGSWDKLRSHIQWIICRNNTENFNYLLGWIAERIQKPWLRSEVAIVLRGREGVGKGMLTNLLLKIFGVHGFLASQPKDIVGDYNGHLKHTVLLVSEESVFAGDPKAANMLKVMITEPRLTSNAKFLDTENVPNFLNIIMNSNADWVVQTGVDARRYFVLDVSDEKIGNFAYFNALVTETENGGAEAFFHAMQQADLKAFNVREFPRTDALRDQQQRSLVGFDAWLRDVLLRGYVYESRFGAPELAKWHEVVATEFLYNSYRQFHGNRPHLQSLQNLGVYLGRSLQFKRKPGILNAIVGESVYGFAAREPRKDGYILGDLRHARVAFDRRVPGNKWPWTAEDWERLKEDGIGPDDIEPEYTTEVRVPSEKAVEMWRKYFEEEERRVEREPEWSGRIVVDWRRWAVLERRLGRPAYSGSTGPVCCL
jgi:hypothetical protein